MSTLALAAQLEDEFTKLNSKRSADALAIILQHIFDAIVIFRIRMKAAQSGDLVTFGGSDIDPGFVQRMLKIHMDLEDVYSIVDIELTPCKLPRDKTMLNGIAKYSSLYRTFFPVPGSFEGYTKEYKASAEKLKEALTYVVAADEKKATEDNIYQEKLLAVALKRVDGLLEYYLLINAHSKSSALDVEKICSKTKEAIFKELHTLYDNIFVKAINALNTV